MNANIQRYRLLQGVLNEHRMYEMFFAYRPICSIDLETLKRGIGLEDRATTARQIIDRARFLAKNSRSKYVPHVGAKQIAKGLG